MCLWHVVNAALINIRILVDDGNRVVYRIIVQLRLVIKQVQLELGGLLDRAREFVGQAMRAAHERVEGRVELLDGEAETLGHGQATVTRTRHWGAI